MKTRILLSLSALLAMLPAGNLFAQTGAACCENACCPAATDCGVSLACGAGDACACDEPLKLFDSCWLQQRRIDVRGWLDAGYTVNPDKPGNRFNGPVTFNDRANEFQLNQLYLVTERATDTCGSDEWDFGGRIDMLYGTDSRFLVANGLETKWNESQRFYGAALPQIYADLAYKNWVFRLGRFYTLVGAESPMAPSNFFYSHSYTFQYGEPFTHAGVLATYKLNDAWSFSGGLHRGWDQWEDNNDKWGFLGSMTWNLPNDKTTLTVGLVSSDEQVGAQSTRTLVSTVLKHKFTDRLSYVFQNDLGHETNVGGVSVEWWGIVNYLLYDLNDCWAVGLRHEVFTDDDGTRVIGLGDARGRGDDTGIPLNGVPSHWQEISLGLRWMPNLNLTVRSEVRWDWVDPMISTSDGPFDDFGALSQFLWGTDVIVKF